MFHEAAIPSVPRSLADPISSNDVNIAGTLNVLHEAKKAGVRRVVYAASSSAYGDTPTLPKIETMRPAPLSPYAVGKLAGEHYCAVFAGAYGLETVCLRYFNVFGARQDPKSEYAAVIPRFVTAGLRGQGVTIFGDGTQSRDFCYIDNTVEANLAAASAPAAGASGQVFNVACGVATTLERRRAPDRRDARQVDRRDLRAERRVGDVKHSLADITAARTRLGYRGAVHLRRGAAAHHRLVREALAVTVARRASFSEARETSATMQGRDGGQRRSAGRPEPPGVGAARLGRMRRRFLEHG